MRPSIAVRVPIREVFLVKFVDEVRIHVKAGDGGNGAVAFRREKFVPRGGPAGGDGGNGGDVVVLADENHSTLLDFRFQPNHAAKNGEHGMGSDCNGRRGDDVVLKVPVGTLIKDAETGEVLHDLTEHGQRIVLAKGGRGGLGNMNFATSTRQAPRFAQPGTKGEEREVILELKLLADVGLLGYPNAGKSTLISRVSRAKPKVADYPFTTLTPHLGVVAYKDHLSFVMADIPGIIEGAHHGAGLGHQFLKHVERCRLLVHVVDCGAEDEDREPLQDFETLNRELKLYSPELAKKPQLVVANKVDLPEARERAEQFAAQLKRKKIPVLLISSATGENVAKLIDACAEAVFGGREREKRAAQREKERADRLEAKRLMEANAPSIDATPAKEPAAETKPAAKKSAAGKTVAKKAVAKKATRAAATKSRPPRAR